MKVTPHPARSPKPGHRQQHHKNLSLVGYFYYPADKFGFDIAADYKNIAAWLDRIKALPG